jgi:hypothetical protein
VRTRRLSRRAVLAASICVAAILPAGPQFAGAAYRWIDAEGNVHYAQTLDAVPERHREGARVIPEAPGPRAEPPPVTRRSIVVSPPGRLPMPSATREEGPVDVRGMRRALADACDPGAPREDVSAAWRATVADVLGKLTTSEVRSDTGGDTIAVHIVDRRLVRMHALAFACWASPGRPPVIVLTGDLLREYAGRGRLEIGLAQTLSHELAHHALHTRAPHARLEHAARERQAEELAIYYYEQAGYDCRQWRASSLMDSGAVRAACDLAKRGARLH